MTHAIEIMTEQELGSVEVGDEAGFGSLATARGNLPLRYFEPPDSGADLDSL